MSETQESLLQKIAVNVNGVAETPVGEELTAWQKRLDDSYQEWANAYDPQILVKTYHTTMAQSGTSVGLPDDFKLKFAGYTKVNGDLWEEFNPVEGTFASGKYITWGGNDRDGYYLNLSAALTSAASLSIPYHSRPISLSTLTSVPIIPDPEFLVDRTTEKIMLQRSQPEYVEFQVKADLLLQRMVANEVSTNLQRNKGIRTQMEYDNFTLGED